MRWLFKPTKITSDGYLTFGSGRDQGGSLKNNFFAYSPAIVFPTQSSLSTDEHGHFSAKCLTKESIKLTIYESHGDRSFGSCIINYIPNWVTSVNLNDANLSTNVGFPTNSGTYYLQFLASDIIRFFNKNGISSDPSGHSLTVDDLYQYPIHIEFVCNTIGYKNTADVITKNINLTSATYNAGYYYIPFTRPDTGTGYSSVYVRAAVVPDCPHSIMELKPYKHSIVYTESTDMNATTGTINTLISNCPFGATRYIKLASSIIESMIEELYTMCSEKIDDYGPSIQVQWFWYHSTEVDECLGDISDRHSLIVKGDNGYVFKHDISLYRGTIPVHKTNRPKLHINWEKYCESKDLYVTWDGIEFPTNWIGRTMAIGFAITNSAYYSRHLEYIDNNSRKERSARGRTRRGEYVVWIEDIDPQDEEWVFTDIDREIRWYLNKKLQYFYNNVDDPYVYIRPVIGYYRQDGDCGNGGYHWLRASDEYIRVDIYN